MEWKDIFIQDKCPSRHSNAPHIQKKHNATRLTLFTYCYLLTIPTHNNNATIIIIILIIIITLLLCLLSFCSLLYAHHLLPLINITAAKRKKGKREVVVREPVATVFAENLLLL